MISSKMGLGTSWPIQNGGGQIFKPPGFCQYFVFSCLIRNGTVMGPPDLESTQKGAPGDIQIDHFGQDPICAKITPFTSVLYMVTPCLVATPTPHVWPLPGNCQYIITTIKLWIPATPQQGYMVCRSVPKTETIPYTWYPFWKHRGFTHTRFKPHCIIGCTLMQNITLCTAIFS